MRSVSTCARVSSVPVSASARSQQHTQLIALEVVATGARGKQTDLGLLDPVLCLTALAVQGVVEFLGISRELGHHVARVAALCAVLQARDHPALFEAGLCAIRELTDFALLDCAVLKRILHRQLHEFGSSLQGDDVVHVGAFAIVNDALTAKARVAPKHDAYLGLLWRCPVRS